MPPVRRNRLHARDEGLQKFPFAAHIGREIEDPHRVGVAVEAQDAALEGDKDVTGLGVHGHGALAAQLPQRIDIRAAKDGTVLPAMEKKPLAQRSETAQNPGVALDQRAGLHVHSKLRASGKVRPRERDQ